MAARSAITEPIAAVTPLPSDRDTTPSVAIVPAEPDPVEASDSAAGYEPFAEVDGATQTELVSSLEPEPETTPRSRRPLIAAISAVAVAAIGLTVWITRPALSPAAIVSPSAPPPSPLDEARRLLDRGDLEGAGRILGAERAARDGLRLQLLLGELEHRRGNRLGALAHYHRATRLSPGDAESHARLAEWLHAAGQLQSACREAKAALAIDAKNAMALATEAAAKCSGSR